MKPDYLFFAALSGLLAVALGAFGAHALEARLSADMLEVWHTAVQYQMFHTVGLLAVHVLGREHPQLPGVSSIGALFVAGMLVFCGSLYVLALTGVRGLGMITPVGGVLFLAGWAQLARVCYGLRKR